MHNRGKPTCLLLLVKKLFVEFLHEIFRVEKHVVVGRRVVHVADVVAVVVAVLVVVVAVNVTVVFDAIVVTVVVAVVVAVVGDAL